jgi:hypothetical protein
MSLPGSGATTGSAAGYASSESISTGSAASGPSAELIYKTPQNVLHALNTGADPNVVYNRSTANIKSKIVERNKARGWFGPKQSLSSYKNYIRKTLAIPRTPQQIIVRIRELLNQPKLSAIAIYNEFNAWRKVINRTGVDPQLFIDINKIKEPGWFGSTKDYIANIIIQMNRYNNPMWTPEPKTPVIRSGALGLRGLTPKAPTKIPELLDSKEEITRMKKETEIAYNIAAINHGMRSTRALPFAIHPGNTGRERVTPFLQGGGDRRTRKIATSRRMVHRHTAHCSHRRTVRRQHGGATPMPLAYYQPGAYETRTLEPTGVGLAGTTSTWVREPVAQTGGRRSRTHRRQAGGFSPSVMGQFADAGLRFALPVVGYMGYKMFNKKSRKGRRKTGRRTRRR